MPTWKQTATVDGWQLTIVEAEGRFIKKLELQRLSIAIEPSE